MTTEETLKALGLDRLPDPRYEVSEGPKLPTGTELVNFRKALMCVDALETAAFSHYIPDSIVIDQRIDTRAFKKGYSEAICIPAYGPIPGVARKTTHATGITTHGDRHNRFLWLANDLKGYYDYKGAKACSPPLLASTHNMLILLFKFDFEMREDLTSETQSRMAVLTDSPAQKLEHGTISRDEFNSGIKGPDAIISIEGENR